MKVKICGITHPKDAEDAIRFGADLIGIIFSDHSRRQVSCAEGKQIAQIAHQTDTKIVGVFTNQTAEQIIAVAAQTNIDIIQLHGKDSQKGVNQLQSYYPIIYAIPVEKSSTVIQVIPPMVTPLFDHMNGGTGISFNWKNFCPPPNRQWMLAGGLTCKNVAEAIRLLNPYGVDVSSGVEFPRSNRKDPALVKAFIQTVKEDV